MNSREIIKALTADGWRHIRTTGSHHHYDHPDKPGLVTVPHQKKDLPIGTVRQIEKQAQLQFKLR